MGLTSCCRCLDLRRGSIAIGIFYVAVSALGILLSIVFIAVGPEIIIRALLFGQIDFHTAIAIIFAMRILLWVSLILCVMMLIVSALLIRGVLINNSCMVLTYVIVQGLVLVLGTIGYIYQLITAISSGVALSITLAVLGYALCRRPVVLVHGGGVLLSDNGGHRDRGEGDGVWREPGAAHAAHWHRVREYGTLDRGGVWSVRGCRFPLITKACQHLSRE